MFPSSQPASQPLRCFHPLLCASVVEVLTLSILMTAVGLVQVRKLSHSGREPSALDHLLSSATVAGVQLYTAFGIVVGAAGVGLVPDILKPAPAFGVRIENRGKAAGPAEADPATAPPCLHLGVSLHR